MALAQKLITLFYQLKENYDRLMYIFCEQLAKRKQCIDEKVIIPGIDMHRLPV